MKVVYAVEAVNLSGGYDRVIIEKANYLAEHGFDVIITVASHALAFIYFVMMRRYRRALKELLLFERPDIVITTLGREIDFITKIHDGSVKIGESHIAKNYVRNLHLMEQNGIAQRMIAMLWRRKMDKLVGQLDALVLLTQHDADSWSGLTRTVVIPNSLPFFPEKPSTCNQKQVIFVGRLNEQKGLEYLVKTWEHVHQKHKEWILQIYGDGDQRDLLHRLIREAKMEDTVIVNQPTRQIMDRYLESSIFLLTSRFEGFGMVLIEAMACGVPVVSFDCPWGPADIIKNGEDGFLVGYLNTIEAAEKVVQLIESPELRKKMGIRARENVQRYSRNTVMKQWIDLFYSLCN